MTIRIQAPSMGESISEATVARWVKAVGDSVAEDELIAELETDKVNLEVTAPQAGKLTRIVASEGSTVSVGDLLAELSADDGEVQQAAQKPAPESSKDEPQQAAATPQPTQGSSSALIDVVAPTMGESISEATVARWAKQEGDSVAEDDLLAELETDKVNLEVTAPQAGVLKSIKTPAGSTVSVGEVMAQLAAGSGEATAKPAAAAARSEAGQSKEVEEPASELPLSPAVAKMVAENKLNPSEIKGTGKGGRLTKGDVLEYMAAQTLAGKSMAAPGVPAPAESRTPAAAPSAVAAVPSAPAGEHRQDVVKMTSLRKTIAKRLKTAQNEAAMLTTYNEVDLSAVMELRKLYKEPFKEQHGVGLGFMSFFTKAVIEALKAWPALNAEIQGEELVYKKYYNIGVAVSTERGLMVPVIRDADKLSFAEIEQAIVGYAVKARENKIGMDDMADGTFTITNGGVFGSMMSMPILNYPQVGIFGMHAIKERPVAVDGKVEIRPMMYVALTYDHRIVDGREAVSFLVKVKEALEDPRRLMLGL